MSLTTWSRLALLAIGFAFLSQAAARHVFHERRDEGSPWTRGGLAPRDLVLPMRIGMKQSNLHLGHDLLMEVSDPNSARYGKHYTAEQVHDLFAPPQEHVAAVFAWLESEGIHPDRISQSTNKQWVQFDADVAAAESLFKTNYHVYEDFESGRTSIGCDEYHLHESIQPHVDYITPGIRLVHTHRPQSRKRMYRDPVKGWIGPITRPLPEPLANVVKAQQSGSLDHCNDFITPNCINALYNISKATTAHKGNQLGIFEDLAEYLDSVDMDKFFANLAPYIPQGTYPTFDGIDGGPNPNTTDQSGSEACLDFQISYPIIYPQQSVLYQTDDAYYNEHYPLGFFNTFLDAIDGSYCTFSAFGITGDSPIDPKYPDPHPGGYKGKLQCGVFKPTNVMSFSYSGNELYAGQPRNYLERQCAEFMKLGMQGISLVFSSGDFGANCAQKNGTFLNYFGPEFPSTCPYITAVGGTSLPKNAKIGVDREVATVDFYSGGGFSNIFTRPSYQDDAVETYLNSSFGPKYPYYTGPKVGDGLYNRSGRAYPDVSANGQGFVIFQGGNAQLVSGTSASAPLFAAILTRINEHRLAAGKSAIGFVNPVLYQNPGAFNDIIKGRNNNCNKKGFFAGPGWDAVTGLGTPDYELLLEAFMKAA